MAGNRVKQLRLEKGLTQQSLAEMASTNQQQIQRIEAGVQKANAVLAQRIASALSVPIDKVFPPIRAGRSSPTSHEGVEPDYEVHTLRVVFGNGIEHFFPIGTDDKRRLWSALQRSDDFVVFDDSRGFRIALNSSRIAFWQFLFDPAVFVWQGEEDEESSDIELYMSGGSEPITLSMEPDPDEFDEDPETAQIQGLFLTLDGLAGDAEVDQIANVTDVDGEVAFIRCRDLLLLRVPLWLVEPKLWQAMIDEEEHLESLEASR